MIAESLSEKCALSRNELEQYLNALVDDKARMEGGREGGA